jgi:hypothetical protein
MPRHFAQTHLDTSIQLLGGKTTPCETRGNTCDVITEIWSMGHICTYRYIIWLVVDLPRWKIWLRQLGLWHSQCMEKWNMFQTTNQLYMWWQTGFFAETTLITSLQQHSFEKQIAWTYAYRSLSWGAFWTRLLYILARRQKDKQGLDPVFPIKWNPCCPHASNMT